MCGRAAKSYQGAVMPPLVYSTELSRSHQLRNIVGVQHFTDPQDRKKFEPLPVRGSEAGARAHEAGERPEAAAWAAGSPTARWLPSSSMGW